MYRCQHAGCGFCESPKAMQNLNPVMFAFNTQVLSTQVCCPALHVSAKMDARAGWGEATGGWKTECNYSGQQIPSLFQTTELTSQRPPTDQMTIPAMPVRCDLPCKAPLLRTVTSEPRKRSGEVSRLQAQGLSIHHSRGTINPGLPWSEND